MTALLLSSFSVGDRISWLGSGGYNLRTRRATAPRTEVGTVYRVDLKAGRLAVLPDSWAREGKRDGLLVNPAVTPSIRRLPP